MVGYRLKIVFRFLIVTIIAVDNDTAMNTVRITNKDGNSGTGSCEEKEAVGVGDGTVVGVAVIEGTVVGVAVGEVEDEVVNVKESTVDV